MQDTSEPLVDRRRIQQLLDNMSDRSFWRALHDEGIPHYRLNSRRFRFRVSEVEQWLATRRVGTAAR